MGRKRRLGESIQDLSGRSGHRVRHDRRNHRQSPPAQRRGSKKGDSKEAIGRSRGGLTTKIHAIVDALGNPLAVSLTGGHVQDVTQAQVLHQEIEPAALLADKGYDSDGFIEHLEVRSIKPVISPRANRKTPRGRPPRLRPGLAQMTTGPRKSSNSRPFPFRPPTGSSRPAQQNPAS